jgi:hypothetical protein
MSRQTGSYPSLQVASLAGAKLAVLDANGKLIYSQKNGEFENARALSPEDVAAFLNQWKPAA